MDFDKNYNPTSYRRQSDLHFISGKASNFFIDDKDSKQLNYPGHAVFFQAPLGITYEEKRDSAVSTSKDIRSYRSLSNLMSVAGYYVKWGKDDRVPSFITNADRYRFRLMQVFQPGETVAIYNNDNYNKIAEKYPGNANDDMLDWLKIALGLKRFPEKTGPKDVNGKSDDSANKSFCRPFAENIISLIIVPKVAEVDRKKANFINDLTEDYEYNSRPKIAYNAQGRYPASRNITEDIGTKNQYSRQLHQLPPILQVTMIAIDEESAVRLESYSSDAQDFSSDLFTKLGVVSETFEKDLGDISNTSKNSLLYRLTNPDHDLPSSEHPRPKLKYRVFTTDVVLRGSKWTKIQ